MADSDPYVAPAPRPSPAPAPRRLPRRSGWAAGAAAACVLFGAAWLIGAHPKVRAASAHPVLPAEAQTEEGDVSRLQAPQEPDATPFSASSSLDYVVGRVPSGETPLSKASCPDCGLDAKSGDLQAGVPSWDVTIELKGPCPKGFAYELVNASGHALPRIKVQSTAREEWTLGPLAPGQKVLLSSKGADDNFSWGEAP